MGPVRMRLNRAMRRMAKKKGLEYTMEAPAETKVRTKEDVQREYNQQAAIAGDTQYRISVLQEDLERMNGALKALNKEALELQSEEAKLAERVTP